MTRGRKKGTTLSQKELANLERSSRRQGQKQQNSKSAQEKLVGVRINEQTQQVLY